MENKTRNRTKLFIDNFLIYGVGGMMSKLIPMIMLPVITRLYPNSEYIGLNDLNQTFISFAHAIVLCGMYDAMFRVFFEYEDISGHRRVCSTALFFVSATSAIAAVICFVFRNEIGKIYFGSPDYSLLVIITIIGFLLSATNQIVSAPTRIQNKRKIFLIANTLAPLISYGICIPMILSGNYLYAMSIGTIVSAVVIEISFGIMNKSYFDRKCYNVSILKDLLKIGIPLMPNFIVYWIYNSADKIMISHMLGNSFTGVYSVASKIGHISNLIYTAFSGGWLYFAYSTMEDDDQVQLKSDIFEYLGAITFSITVLILGVSRIVFTTLFPGEYLEGYLVMPYLFISPLLLMLYQVIANQFSIVKKTYLNLLALSLGALLNIVFNYCLIPKLGIEGASIATITGYVVSIVSCTIILKKMKLVNINKNVITNVVTISLYFVAWRFVLHENIIISLATSVVVFLLFAIRYRRMIHRLITKIRENNI